MKKLLLGLSILVVFNLSAQEQGTLLSQWSDSTLVASTAHNNTYNEIWGYAVNNKEYAIIGTTKGTHFIDVTDPTNPVESYVINGASMGAQIIHRDYHDYNGYLYIVADEGGASTLQIVDISVLPEEPIVVSDNQFLINRAHNIFIDESAGRMYGLSVRTSSGFAAFTIYDLSDPVNPIEIHRGNRIGDYLVNHVHDAFVKDNIGYFNCGGDGLAIGDFTDVDNIELIHSLTTAEYPQAGYNHSGWLSEDGNTYYFADETHGRDMKILDVSSSSSVSILGTLTSSSDDALAIPHNQVIHENFLYVSYYYDGLQVYDISDPLNVNLIMHYPTSNINHRDRYEGAWGVYPFLPSGNILVSDMQEGLFVIEKPVLSNTDELENLYVNVDIFPNPTFDNITIKNNALVEITSIDLIDFSGRLISRKEVSIPSKSTLKYSINQDEGSYILKMKLANNTHLIQTVVISYKE